MGDCVELVVLLFFGVRPQNLRDQFQRHGGSDLADACVGFARSARRDHCRVEGAGALTALRFAGWVPKPLFFLLQMVDLQL